MVCKDTNNSSAQDNNLIPEQISPSANDKDHGLSIDYFLDHYCPIIYSAVARLTGITDLKELEDITVNILVKLWESRREFIQSNSSGLFIFKILLRFVFCHLREQGNESRIEFLKDILPVNPSIYLCFVEPKKTPLANSLLRSLRKIKTIWKTF
jgi:DNA-directed RNA polymerase specialized sigma24 family protein